MGKATAGTEDQQIFKTALAHSTSTCISALLLLENATDPPLLSDEQQQG